MGRNKVGILTWHYYSNFGSALQSFALQEIIKSIGYSVDIINYRNIKFGNPKNLKSRVKKLFSICIPRRLYEISSLRKLHLGTINFQRKYLKQTRVITDLNDLRFFSKRYRAIVYGSDQIWAPNVLNSIYLGEGIADGVRKISYAASIGVNEIPEDMLPLYKSSLSEFYAISIREGEGQQLLSSKLDIDSCVVLDPTLMIPLETYKGLEYSYHVVNQPYIFCYFLNKNHRYRACVESFAKEHNLTIIGVSDGENDSNWMQKIDGIGADQFLWLIHHAKAVFTDSYHGSIFSLRYHKDLYIFNRFKEDSPICQNSRIRELVRTFSIHDRVVPTDSSNLHLSPIDYDAFERQLKSVQSKSLYFIKQALKNA